MTVSLRHYRRHSVPIQYVSTLKNHEGGHPTGDHFTTKNPILSGESHDFSEGTAVRIKHAFLPQLSAAQMTGVFCFLQRHDQFSARPSLPHKGVVPLYQVIRQMQCSCPS